MPSDRGRLPLTLMLLAGLMTVACDKLTLPRISHDQPVVQPQGLSSVNLIFEESVRTATLERPACFPEQGWEGRLGHSIATTFLDVSRKSFGKANMLPPGSSPGDSSVEPADLTVRLSLVDKSFGEGTPQNWGEENYSYAVDLHVELLAIYYDRNGDPIGKAPLVYRKAVNTWTPIIDPTTCQTAQLDAAMDKASEGLAHQMVTIIANVQSPRQPGTAVAQAPGTPAPQYPAVPAGPSAISFRATLMDENDNLILEAGEKIGVRLDATNTGTVLIASSSVTLSGTSALIDAFATTMAAPIDIGSLQPGETKSTVFWGKMPATVQPQQGQLTISVRSASSTASQTLVAAIRPATGVSTPTTPPRPSPTTVVAPPPPVPASRQDVINRYAVIIGIDRYRAAWPQARPVNQRTVSQAATTLKRSLGISREQILVLRGEHATKTDVEEAVLEWMPKQIDQDSIVIFHLSGQAVADPQYGEIFLIPYEGSPSSPQRRLLSLHALQNSLKRTKAKLVLLLVDAIPVASASPTPSKNGKPARLDWGGVITSSQGGRSVRLIQLVGGTTARSSMGQLLKGLEGAADSNQDNRVTLGEFMDYSRGKVKIYPVLPQNSAERAIALTGKP